MAKITYPNKNIGDQFFATEANEIKAVVNGLDDAIATKSDATAVTSALAGKLDKSGGILANIHPQGKMQIGPSIADFLLSSTGVITWNIVRDNATGIWTVGNNGANNGAGIIFHSITQGLKIIQIPSTGASNQTFTDAQLAAMAVSLDPSSKADKDLSINTQTASYTLQASDRGKLVLMDVASAHTVTVPLGLPPGFQCIVQTIGAGQTTFVPGSGMTLKNRGATYKSAGVDAVSTVFTRSSTIATVAGDLVA